MLFKDDYKWLSGWIHDYYCDEDGSLLIFNADYNHYFECPLCHYKYTDSKRKRAWIIKYRYKIFDTLEEYSKRYLLERKEEYLKFIEDALEYYSLNYDYFKIHNKEGKVFSNYIKANRCGRITSQGLNEAMIAIQMVNCLEQVGPYLNDHIKRNVYHILFVEIYNLLKLQVSKIHNIDCYEVCAIGMMGIISNNREMIDFAFHSKYSFFKQLDDGVTENYFWFEGSFHYHLFVLKPILQLLRMTKKFKYDVDKKYYDLAEKMLVQSYKCSFHDCSLPSPNDGWPNRHLSDYRQVFELGNELFPNRIKEILSSINNKSNNNQTVHFINTGFSLLKNEYWNVFIKYQDNNTNHAHPDKLNIEVKHNGKYLTHDLSNSGYGSDISKNFYKKTYAHNTIVIGGQDQNIECDSIVQNYAEDMILVEVNNAYDECSISRKIQILSKIMSDELVVTRKNREQVDYFFHCDAKLMTVLDSDSISFMKEYPYLKRIKEIKCSKDELILEWDLYGEKLISKVFLKDKKLYICESPNNPNQNQRITLLIRDISNDKKIIFSMLWSF